MCGIIGIVGREEAAPRLMDGLRRLEYRGYDCAGICTIVDGRLERRRAEGKLDNLARELDAAPLAGTVGIAHTRWATHGAPTVGNAHPHIVGGVAVVHNGIIENFTPLREEMQAKGRTFASETDSEVVAHLVADQLEQGSGPRGGGRRRAAAPPRRLRARHPVPRPSRHDRRRAPGRAAHRRLSATGRIILGSDALGARRADPAHRLSRRGRLGGGHP